MSTRPETPLLDTVNTPEDLRKLDKSQLRQLSDELRAEVLDAVGQTGGHLGSGLGVVELTAAIHYVFDTPQDKLVWDVGHQCYPHKILTGRRDRIRTLRQGGGLSGFTKRSESEYDPFGAAHSSTSISAALGFAMANKMQDRPGRGIAVIGDGAMSAGMAYEAMNNAEQAGNRLVVILNDNDMSIAPPVGGLSAYLARMVSSSEYLGLRTMASKIAKKLGRRVWGGLERAEEYARGMATGGTLFEELGFYYVGPIDGHNLEHLIPVLENVRDSEQGPVLIHVVTQKGKGYAPAENSADKYHGVAKFDVVTGEQKKSTGGPPAYQNVFGETLAKLADSDPRICAITAAMPSGTGVDKFAKALYRNMSNEDLTHRNDSDLYGAALSLWNSLESKKGDDAVIRVFNPEVAKHGWQSSHTIVEIIAKDMPFLVDSVRMALNRANIASHLLLHTPLKIQRDKDGTITNLSNLKAEQESSSTKTVFFIEIDR